MFHGIIASAEFLMVCGESGKPLLFYCNTMPLLLIVDQRRLTYLLQVYVCMFFFKFVLPTGVINHNSLVFITIIRRLYAFLFLSSPRIIHTRDSHFFTNRTINLWNSIPDSIVTAPTVNCFKRRLDKFLL